MVSLGSTGGPELTRSLTDNSLVCVHGQVVTLTPVKQEDLTPRAEREIVRHAHSIDKARTALIITFPVRNAQGLIDPSTNGVVDESGSWISWSVLRTKYVCTRLRAIVGRSLHNDRYTVIAETSANPDKCSRDDADHRMNLISRERSING